MAQIGSPPAGWYTDPSGTHLARFWDGFGWTDQVRDDLSDLGGEGAGAGTNGAAEPGRAPVTSPMDVVLALPVDNPAAQTVAGVAEAVAAVAASDVTYVPEPPFVVDYGGEEILSTGATSVAPGEAVLDPFAAVAAPTPEAEPVMPAVEPVADPVPQGPVPGWYPDPAARHQARYWDGARWTERVADQGTEGTDPLPGAPAAAATDTAAPADAGGAAFDPGPGVAAHVVTETPVWASMAGDSATGPTGAAGGGTMTVEDGASASAGQISLASLPEIDDPRSAPERVRVRPAAKVRVAGGMIFGGAVALLVGSAMTWMEVRGPRVGDQWTETGVGLGDGRITIALAVVLAVLGATIVAGWMSRLGGAKVAAMGALVAGAAALAVCAVDIADVADRASRLGVPAGAVTDVGSGLWLAFVGSLVAVAGGLLAFANRQS